MAVCFITHGLKFMEENTMKLLRCWRKNKTAFALMLFGYVITILVIALMTGRVQNEFIVNANRNFGNVDNRSGIKIVTSNDNKNSFAYKSDEIIKFLGKTGEVNVMNLVNEQINTKYKMATADIEVTYFENSPNWTPKLSSGEYLLEKNCINGEKYVLIGIGLAEKLDVKVNDEIGFYNENYKIKGIIGKKFVSTNLDNVMIIPVTSLPNEYLQSFKNQTINENDKSLNLNIIYRVKPQNIDAYFNELKNKFDKNTFHYDIKKNLGGSNLGVSISNELMEIIPITIVTLINFIIISSNWVISRKKEITIKKILGATDSFLKNMIVKELIALLILSLLVAEATQLLLYRYVEGFVNSYNFSFDLTPVNFLVGAIVVTSIGYLTTLIPVEKTLEMKITDGIKVKS